MRIFKRYRAKHTDTAELRNAREAREHQIRREHEIATGSRADWGLAA